MVRVKFRYLVVNFLYPEPATKSSTTPLPDIVQIHSPTPDAFHAGLLIRMIRDQVQDLYGDYGIGMVSAGLKINYHSPSTSTAIIRCPRDHYEMVWAALTYVTHLPKPLNNIPVVTRVVRVSGTIRKAEEEVIRRSQRIVKRARDWERRGGLLLPMLQSVEKAVERERRNEGDGLVRVDGSESDAMSE